MINFDNASTTKISKKALEAYNVASEIFYNPSALYAPAMQSKSIIDNARTYILKYLKGKPSNSLVFTSSASESNNMVLNSVVVRKDKKYLIGAGEHSSIFAKAENLRQNGYNIQYIPLLPNGAVDIEKYKAMLDEDVAFVSVIHVSNETGAINDIKTLNALAKGVNKSILFHSDGVQALGKLNINLTDLGVDFYTISAHKINGPKGIGALYISNPTKIKPLIFGGGQEFNLRAGTENVAGIHAFYEAVKNLTIKDLKLHKQTIINSLRGDYVLVSDDKCVDNIISICFKGVRGETILHIAEQNGFLIGTGSSCNSKAGVNRVVSQLVDKNYIQGAIRLSFDNDVSKDDCIKLCEVINNAVKTYREKIGR